ncbi:hypothetical protein F-VV10_0179 [Faustovirus]|nr:hypothetical protein F-VV10_0179 [Faustovirus]
MGDMAVILFALGLPEIVDVICDCVGHNQVFNILRMTNRALREALPVYRGYNLIDYFVHCRLNFDAPLYNWMQAGWCIEADFKLYRCGSSSVKPPYNTIRAKFHESIIEQDASEYVKICGMSITNELRKKIIKHDKWRLFRVLITNYDREKTNNMIIKYMPKNIITMMYKTTHWRKLGSCQSIDVFKHNRAGEYTVKKYEPVYIYPMEITPLLVANCEMDAVSLDTHVKMFCTCSPYSYDHVVHGSLLRYRILQIEYAIPTLETHEQFIRLDNFIKRIHCFTKNIVYLQTLTFLITAYAHKFNLASTREEFEALLIGAN